MTVKTLALEVSRFMSFKRYCSKCGKEFDGNSLTDVVIRHLNKDHKLPLDSKELFVEAIATALTSSPPCREEDCDC